MLTYQACSRPRGNCCQSYLSNGENIRGLIKQRWEDTMRYRSLKRRDTCSRWLNPMIHLEQGDSDSLCVYYSAAMLLLAFYPRYLGQVFASADADPILRHVKPIGRQSRERMIAGWLFDGMAPKRVAQALNRLADAEGLAFQVAYEERNKIETTFEEIQQDIDRGLPVLLCYKSQSLGHHAVVVDGYQIEGQRRERQNYWLRLCDPGGDDLRQWEQLTSLSNGRLELVRVMPQDELPRPDLCTAHANKDGVIIERRRERYWFHDGKWGWINSEDLFKQIIPRAS